MHPRVSCTRLCGQQWIVCPLLWVYRVLAVPRGCRSKARFSSRRLVHRCVGRTEIVLIAEEVFRDSKLSAACMRQCHRPLRLHENTEETHRSCFFFFFFFFECFLVHNCTVYEKTVILVQIWFKSLVPALLSVLHVSWSALLDSVCLWVLWTLAHCVFCLHLY